MFSHDAYELEISSSNTGSIEVTAGSSVDFYVMTATGYAEYLDPNASSFHVQDSSENSQSFSYSTTQSSLIFVIDNDDVSTTGASSSAPVTYDLAILFAAAPPSDGWLSGGLSIVLAIVTAVVVFSVIAAAVFVRHRRTNQPGFVSQQVVPPQPLAVPPTSIVTAASTPSGNQTAGTIRRAMSDPERDQLVRDFKDQRVRMIAGSIVGLVLALAYNVFPNLMTLGLSTVAFITPAIAYGIVRLRRAIMAGRVIEFQGVPAVLGTTRVAKQDFFRLQFGTESVLVSSGLYGRFVPNHPSSLTVLEGANLALAVNGVPLPKTEKVRFATDGKSPTGSR